MFCIKSVFLIVSLSTLNNCINCLETPIGDDTILRTEAAVRNTTNKLFSALKLKRANPRFNQYLIINQFFTSLTLQDHGIWNEIVKISRVNNVVNNESFAFMTAINDLLNGDNQEVEENEITYIPKERNDDDVVEVIKTFLNRLREAKKFHQTDTYGKINGNIVKLLRGGNNESITLQDWRNENYLGNENSSEDIEFWEPSGRRVYKGERTKIKHFPFMASIQIFNNFQCGGSIIKSDLIITASSCLQLAWNNRFYRENPAFLSVRVGSSFYNGGGEVIPVLEVYFHPGYNPKTLRNNICILRLTRKIRFSWRSRRRVRKIDFDRHDNALPINTPGITILGWGAKGRSNVVRDPWQNILSVAILDVYPLKDCQDIYSKEYVTQKNFCAGFMSKGGGACNRDIGGPGIDDGILMGVVSFGSPVCGAPDAPTVFTKLGYYADWIDSILEQDVPYSKKKTTLAPPKHLFTLPTEHSAPKSATFKLPPPGAKMKPIPINEVENALRNFDEDLFEEFLKTMFENKDIPDNQKDLKQVNNMDGKEQKKYKKKKAYYASKEANSQDSFKKKYNKEKKSGKGQNKHIKGKKLNELQKVTSPLIDFETRPTTKVLEYKAEEAETVTYSDYSDKYTILDDGLDPAISDNDDIADLMDKIDLKELVEEEPSSVGKERQQKSLEEPAFFKEIDSSNFNTKNESVFTLLYLSDENNEKGDDSKRSGEGIREDTGLSIFHDSFQDLTRNKGKHEALYDIMPEKELYEILSELIEDEMRHNKTR